MSQTKRKVLVVDDELDTAQTLRLILESSGFRVDIFTDPKEALGTFIPAYYDLAVIDVRMPDMNGFELYSEIKSIDHKIKVLFLTALTDLHDYDDFKCKVSPRMHQRHFVQKPVEKDQFLDQVYFILF
jgi:two-component system, OmpR family, response regulator ChvI